MEASGTWVPTYSGLTAGFLPSTSFTRKAATLTDLGLRDSSILMR